MVNKEPKPKGIVSKLQQVEVLIRQGIFRLDAMQQIEFVE